MQTEKPKTAKRICVIGAGPSGMSALYHFCKLEKTPEIVCFEKQKTWGGMWNYEWRTGLDEYGEPCHSGMYKDLLINLPKEGNIELPDYTFKEHFGEPMPSYSSRAEIKDYYEGRWTRGSKTDLKKLIEFNTVVRNVSYIDDDDQFSVTVENLETGETKNEIFSHCLVATGIFSFPYTPTIPGIDSFDGRYLHSHDFRNGKEFKGQSVLIIGASLSAEDIALHCQRNGAVHVIVSWKSKPLNHKWPQRIEERPLIERLDSDSAYFKDGTTAKIDSIIICTGYKCFFPFLESRLRISPDVSYYPDGLYKGTLFISAAKNKLFYIGAQRQFYTGNLFDSIAVWVCKYIMETLENEPRSKAAMEADCKLWTERASVISDARGVVAFATSMMIHLGDLTGYRKEIAGMTSIMYDWIKDKEEGIGEFRRKSFRSVYTSTYLLHGNK